jgi:hypothetical protein
LDRRNFLKTSVPALAAVSLGLTGCGDDTTPAAPVPPPEVGAGPFPAITWITRDPSYTDYRPAVDATAQQAVFERTPFPHPAGTNTTLYLATSIGSPNPPAKPFLEVPANPAATYPYSQTRPDWSWVNHQVVFSGAPSESSTIEAHIATANGKTVTLVPKTLAHIYPTWTSDGTQLVIYNNSTSAAPVKPVTSLIMPDGNVVVANLNGTDTANPPADMFGGFAAPKPGTPTQIAFAGQPALPNWGLPPGQTPPPAATYNQDNNYVFINSPKAGGGYQSSPLESAASMTTFDPAFQGRAPYWSPDGKYIVFESSRNGGYALFLARVGASTPPVQVTDSTYWAQHAKFFPGGAKLVFTALQQPNAAGTGPRGIGVIDISSYLG